ncbi:hypothetical protein RIR_jg14744.t2 [Rhizophagus irregularis DAOM 181602=DAOM 197198]|nr:hypothetical protein RIR_jg14744.t2 [Rhizophagus irregularis DAOM 181602=DAOM 197198]
MLDLDFVQFFFCKRIGFPFSDSLSHSNADTDRWPGEHWSESYYLFIFKRLIPSLDASDLAFVMDIGFCLTSDSFGGNRLRFQNVIRTLPNQKNQVKKDDIFLKRISQ